MRAWARGLRVTARDIRALRSPLSALCAGGKHSRAARHLTRDTQSDVLMSDRVHNSSPFSAPSRPLLVFMCFVSPEILPPGFHKCHRLSRTQRAHSDSGGAERAHDRGHTQRTAPRHACLSSRADHTQTHTTLSTTHTKDQDPSGCRDQAPRSLNPERPVVFFAPAKAAVSFISKGVPSCL